MKFSGIALFLTLTAATVLAQTTQWVEGFDQVEFHHNAPRAPLARDFRGVANSYIAAAWYAPTEMKEHMLSWKTAVVPAQQATTFAFIGASAVLPSEYSRGPQVKLSVNGRYALTFTIGFTRDMTWKEGDFELKYISKRVEYPYTVSHRSFELNGNSGIYQLSVPASVVTTGQPTLIKVQLMPFANWPNGWFAVKERRDVLKQSTEILAGEVESLRKDMANANMQLQVLATQVYGDLLTHGKFEHKVIYSNGYRHVHPADLLKLQNGELLLMWREAAEHLANDGDVVMVRSKDGGFTWGERQVIAAIKDVDEREGCGIQLQDGTIVVGVFFNNLYLPNGDYRPSQGKDELLATPHQRYLGAYTITSKDNGHTWSEPHYIDTDAMPFTNLEGPTDAPIEMPDGSILMGVIGYSPKQDLGNRSAVMLRSTNKGMSWQYLSTMASDPGGRLGGFLEPGIVRTKSGRIVAALRNDGNNQPVYITFSDDDGKTWEPVRETAMIGSPIDLIQLSDGRLMATYGVRTPRHTSPGGVRACFSSDNGQSWDIQTEVQIRNDFLNWDIGYPESLELPDGRVMTVYYYNLFNKYYIGATYWRP